MKYQLTRHLIAGVAALVVMGSMSAIVQEAQGADQTAVRKAMMKQNSAMLKNVKRVLKGGRRAVAAEDLAIGGEILAANADNMLRLFPRGSGGSKTRAKAAIWKDWSGFKAAAAVMKAEANKFTEVALTGDKAAIKKQAGRLGKVACGGCHKKFRRGKKKKKKKMKKKKRS